MMRGTFSVSPFRAFLLISFIFAVLAPSAKAAEESHLKRTLTPEQFQRAGLNKLTPEELAELERLVQLRQAGETAVTPNPPRSPVATVGSDAEVSNGAAAPDKALPQGEAAFGMEEKLYRAVEKQQKVPSEIRSPIIGKFTGWKGGTTFELENGQIWRQADNGSFYMPGLKSPTAVIRKGLLGTFFLNVEGYNSRVKVVRVK
jgi:hypothetical protein